MCTYVILYYEQQLQWNDNCNRKNFGFYEWGVTSYAHKDVKLYDKEELKLELKLLNTFKIGELIYGLLKVEGKGKEGDAESCQAYKLRAILLLSYWRGSFIKEQFSRTENRMAYNKETRILDPALQRT